MEHEIGAPVDERPEDSKLPAKLVETPERRVHPARSTA